MGNSRVRTLIRNVRMELGEDAGYGVAVELSDGQIVHSIRAAFTLYNRYFPIQSIQSFRAPAGQSIFEPDPKIRGIVALSIQSVEDSLGVNAATFSPLVSMGAGSVLGFGHPVDLETPRRYANFLEWKRGVKDTFSSTPGYFFQESENKLYVYAPSESVLITIYGALDFDVAWDEEEMWDEEGAASGEPSPLAFSRLDKALGEVSNSHMRWLRTGTIAKAKQILGRMLRKYGELPTIDGESVTQDGSELVQEGKEEWKDLSEEIRLAEPEPPPIIG